MSSYNLYTISIPVFTRGLRNLSHLLDKAQVHIKTGNVSEQTLLDSRLAPDMLPLTFQIENACDHATSVVERLSSSTSKVANGTIVHDSSTFTGLQDRIAKTIRVLEGAKEDEIARADNKEVLLDIGPYHFKYTGRKFVEEWTLPNFWFHVSTAYALIRKSGAEIGKQDFIGDMPLVSVDE